MAWSLQLASKGGPEANIAPLQVTVFPYNYAPVRNVAGGPSYNGGLSLAPVNRVGWGLDGQLGTTRVLQGPAPAPAVFPEAQEQVRRGDVPSSFLPVVYGSGGVGPAFLDSNTYEGPSTALVIGLVLAAGAAAFIVAKFT